MDNPDNPSDDELIRALIRRLQQFLKNRGELREAWDAFDVVPNQNCK